MDSAETKVKTLKYKSTPLEDEETWKSELEREGFTVIRAVAGEEEVVKAQALTWEWLESLGTGIKKAEPDTWTHSAWPGHGMGVTMVSQGAAHLGATWYLRGLPRLKEVFTRFWETKELIVSLDGMIIWRPWSEQEDRRPANLRLHADQSPVGKPGFHCLQGMVPLFPVTQITGGTVLVPGSHLMAAELLERHPAWSERPGHDFCALRPSDPLQGEEALVPLMPGDLLLWDSRLVHGAKVGSPCSDEEGHNLDPATLARASMCVTMGPRDKASTEVLTKRKQSVHKGWHFTHWPWETPRIFGEVRGQGKQKYRVPELSSDQLKLLGWTSEELANGDHTSMEVEDSSKHIASTATQRRDASISDAGRSIISRLFFRNKKLL